MSLPINLDDLLHQRTIENHRIEFKATWDEQIKSATIRSISAFANDLNNLNGGYIILGVEEQDGRPVFPPRGLDDMDIDLIQRDISGACKGNINPDYLPVLFAERYQDSTILVIWAPAGDNRPYEAPKRDRSGKTYWIRSGSSTIEATGDLKRQLFECAAKIPYDDRRSLIGEVTDISIAAVKKFLVDIRSHLSTMDFDPIDLLKKLRLTIPINNHVVPRNIALLFFNEDPSDFFSGAYIEVVQFGDDAGGDLIEEKAFKGAIPDQIRSCLNYINSIGGGTLIEKIPGQPEVDRTVPYPYEALRESIVNAVYHRSYDAPPEPVKIYMFTDRIEITSYPGPVTGINLEHFLENKIPALPARNRRIGELLKDLRLAEMRGTGIPKIQRRMLENGSPSAKFEFDEDRTFFRVTLPAHPRYRTLHFLREASHHWVTGEKDKAINILKRALDQRPNTGSIVAQLIEYASHHDKDELIQKVWEKYAEQKVKEDEARVYISYARILIDKNKISDAAKILRMIPENKSYDETVEAAILRKRTGDLQGAHKLFAEVYSLNPNDPKIIHEFAQTKSKLATQLWKRRGGRQDLTVYKKLNREVAELLRKAIQLSDNPVREAWCWYDLASTLERLQEPPTEVETAFLKARSLLPEEKYFINGYNSWKDKRKKQQN